MYNGMDIYRGVVSYYDEFSVYVQIPALAGNGVPLKISKAVSDPRVSVGDQVIVAVEDDKAYNIHVMSGIPATIAQDGGSA